MVGKAGGVASNVGCGTVGKVTKKYLSHNV